MPQQPRGDGDVVGAVPEREVEAPPARPARERAPSATSSPSALAASAAAAVAADDLALEPEALGEPDRLREVARGDLAPRAPRARSRSMTGRRTRTCGLLVRSTQTRIAHGGDDLVDLLARERGA